MPAETGVTDNPNPKSMVPANPTTEPTLLTLTPVPPPPPPPEIATLVIEVIRPFESTTI